MKMQDNNSDKELEWFFMKMKEKDREIPVPKFPEKKKPRSWYLIPIGIAASLSLVLLFSKNEDQVPNPPIEVIIITLENDADSNQQILIEEKTFLETWEPPTASLLFEY